MNLASSEFDMFATGPDFTLGTRGEYLPANSFSFTNPLTPVGVMDAPQNANVFPDILGSITSLIKTGFETSLAIDQAEAQAELEQRRAETAIAVEQARAQATIAQMSQPRIITAVGGMNPAWLLGGAVGLVALLAFMRKK